MRKREVLIAGVAMVSVIVGCGKPNPVVGTWVRVGFMGSETPLDDRDAPPRRITFLADGTFEDYVEVHKAGMDVVGRCHGTYTLKGNKLSLVGPWDLSLKEGSKANSYVLPFDREFTIEKNKIVEHLGSGCDTEFVREGAAELLLIKQKLKKARQALKP